MFADLLKVWMKVNSLKFTKLQSLKCPRMGGQIAILPMIKII